MAVLGHHALLVLSVISLAGAGLRAASLAAPRGLERVVVAAVLAAAAAVLEPLLLGLLRLGTSAVPLAGAAALAWLGAHVLLPRPAVPVAAELSAAWRGAPLGGRVAVAGALGAGLAWTVWLLRYPALGIDSIGYHLPEIVGWLGNGSPGAVEPVFPNLPIGNYPLTNEVLLAWGMGIGRSFVFVSLAAPAMMLLLVVAGWGGLRSLGVPREFAAVGLGALCATPVLTHYQQNGASTDLPALAWLVSASFLALRSARRPEVLAPALVAAGLAVGTKTTTLPLASLVIVLAAASNPGALRRLAWPLGLAAAGALAVGGYWYLRNLVDHGSPLWPFVRTPWGDPLPHDIGPARGVNSSFLDRPGFTLDRVGSDWRDLFGGGFLLLGAALLAPLAARERRVTAMAGATGASVFIWMNAPFTGASVREFDVATASTVRYLLPALAAAILTLCLAGASRRRMARAFAGLFLAAGLVVNVLQTADLGYPSVPSFGTLLVGAALGAIAAIFASLAPTGLPALTPARRALASAIGCVAVGILLATAASGYVERHASTARLFGTDMVRWFTRQAAFHDGHRPVAGAPITVGPLAGDRLQHRFEWISDREPCSGVLARQRRGYVVVMVLPATGTPISRRSARCLKAARPRFRSEGFRVYGG
jgi:hypothetical protein